MLIEIDEVEQRKSFLTKVVDLPYHTYLLIGGQKIFAEFDPRQGSEDKLSSVQYLKFNLTQEQADQFKDGDIVFGFDHKEYSHEYKLSDEERNVLADDMRA
jgi:hypothetical protein